MTDGVHDLGPDEADPFDSLLERAKALKAGDDIGLEALAKAATEAKMSLPRVDKLTRAASKATGFALIAVRKVFDETRAKLERQTRAEKQADPSVLAAEAAARLAALDAETAAREAECERLRQACRPLAEDPKLIEKIGAIVHRLGVVGERANIHAAYLVATSRLLEKSALSLLRRGAAAGGKNFLIANVVTLLPEEDVIQLSGMSATGLIYFGEDENSLRNKLIIVVEAAALAERANGDENPALILLRSLLSENCIDRLVTIPQRNGPPQSIRIRRNGPVAVMMTSARSDIESEMLTRLLVCDADESPEQSERVLERKLNQGERLEAVSGEEIELWQNLQRWLALDRPYRVAIPFEKAIHEAYIELIKQHREILRQLRIRRDISGLLIGIQASAVLHKAQRQTDAELRIVATLDDYQHAWSAFAAGVSALYGTRVRKEIAAVVRAAEEMGAELYNEAASHGVGGDNPSIEITVSEMRQALGVGSNSTANNRLKEAVEQKVLRQDHDRPNRGRATPRAFWLLRTSKDLEANDGPSVFPSPEAVKKFLERGGGSDCNRHAVHAARVSPGNGGTEADEKIDKEVRPSGSDVRAVYGERSSPDGEDAQTPYAAHLLQSETPHPSGNFSNSTPEPRNEGDDGDDIVDEGEL